MKTIYFSDKINHYWNNFTILENILKEGGSSVKLLAATKDIWCRDYMPVKATDGQLIQFRYEPSYLQSYEYLQSLPHEVNEINGIKATYSNINLDGGNVVRWKERVIISDRIFSENKEWASNSIVTELERLLQAEILIFPSSKSDMTGHADGMARFYKDKTLLITDTDNEYQNRQKDVEKFLIKYNFEKINIPSFIYKAKGIKNYNAIGCYINFLMAGDHLIIPQFECEGNRDNETFEVLKGLYPEHRISTINAFEIAQHGGVLNCVSWSDD